jgi:histidine triad (HIT) family protein
MSQPSIFTKIINGEVPSHKVYEDERTYAFLDIHPVQPGHVLVIPKTQVNFMWDLDDADYQAVMATVKKVAQRLKEVFPDQKRVGVQIEGFGVSDHAHVNVFPFSSPDTFRKHVDMDADPNHDELAAIAERLRF